MTSVISTPAPRMVMTAASALLTVGVFVAVAASSGIDGLTDPTPGIVFVSAVVVTAVVPPVRGIVARFAERSPRWASPESYDIVAFGARLTASEPGLRPIHSLAESTRRLVGGASVTIRTEMGSATAGEPAQSSFRAMVTYRGEEIASIDMTTAERLTEEQTLRVEQLSSSLGAPLANAVAIERLEQRVAELDEAVDLVAQRRRAIVALEATERARVASEVAAGATPIFERLRAQVGASDFEDAAETSEELIVLLRSFSTAMRET